MNRFGCHARGFVLAALLAVMSLAGCKPGIPGKYLQPDEMADILYDYHLAEGITNTADAGDSLALRTFRASILERHGVSVADFDSSMVYYTRHTKLLEDVYKKVVDRLNNESVALGGSTAGMGDFASSDTTNVWNQSPAFVLSPYAATNRMAFAMKADSAYHAGDRLMLDFDAQFICQDGSRNAVAVLAVTYDNDSTELATNSVMSSAHYHMQINNTGRLGIKAVRGFLMLSTGSADPAASLTTLRLLVVSNVRLVRMHTAAPEPAAAPVAADSAVEKVSPVTSQPVKDDLPPLSRPSGATTQPQRSDQSDKSLRLKKGLAEPKRLRGI